MNQPICLWNLKKTSARGYFYLCKKKRLHPQCSPASRFPLYFHFLPFTSPCLFLFSSSPFPCSSLLLAVKSFTERKHALLEFIVFLYLFSSSPSSTCFFSSSIVALCGGKLPMRKCTQLQQGFFFFLHERPVYCEPSSCQFSLKPAESNWFLQGHYISNLTSYSNRWYVRFLFLVLVLPTSQSQFW